MRSGAAWPSSQPIISALKGRLSAVKAQDKYLYREKLFTKAEEHYFTKLKLIYDNCTYELSEECTA